MEGNLKITKELFVSIMKTLEASYNYSCKVNSMLEEMFEDSGGYPRIHKLEDQLIDLLNLAFQDPNSEFTDDTIEYFIYDLDFGKTWSKYCMTEQDGTIIDLSTAEKLYDYLMKEHE